MDDNFTRYSVTCHTDGCVNAGITLEVWADADSPIVVCGPCEHRITDFVQIDS